MNKQAKLPRALTAAALAAAFAGSGLTTVGTALRVDAAGPAWLMAALAAGCCALATLTGAGALVGLVALAALTGGYALTHLSGLRAIRVFLSAWQGGQADPTQITLGAQTLLVCLALLFGALFFLMLYKRGFTGMAIMLLSAMLIFSHSMSRETSIPASIPGLIAGAAAFALSDGVRRDFDALRVLLPSALAVALALAILPGTRVTWKPLEDLANRVRNVFEQYFNYTHERIAFSISEEGYNFGGEIDGQPVAMLGGPANPDPSPVMKVTANGPLLLRGTIRSTYTGYSWIDITPKSRYLYFDLTHRNVRDRVFDLHLDSPASAFSEITGEVQLIDSGTSTLFVPGRLKDFDMDLSIAVYYNSSGEMFMAREAVPGDLYRVTALTARHDEALRQAALKGEGESDSQYDAILAANSQLPEGIEQDLYALTFQLTGNSPSPYDRAEAIADYLRRNMRYKLDVDYPPRGRDFASYFVLDSRQGYCSYFATAMAVMGRIAGLPTRYVEGYYARPDAEGVAVLNGMDAHAWAEVYLKGLGWVPYDATNGGPAVGGSAGSGQGQDQYGSGDTPQDGDTQNTPFDDPDNPIDGTDDNDIANTEGGAPDEDDQNQSDDQNDDQNDATPDDLPPDAPEDDPQDDGEQGQDDQSDPTPDEAGRSGGAWWWLLLLLLLVLIALSVFWIRKRLEATDLERLCRNSRRSSQAAMMIYRASLTLLAHMGQLQQGGETPEAFVERVSGELDNPDYAEFVHAVTLNRYAGKPLRKDQVEIGLRAYRQFLHAMRRPERLRFTLTRLLHGLGDFENIP